MKLEDVLAVLRQVAPESLAEPWDKVGLQVGGKEETQGLIHRALLCIDLTPAVAREAIACGAELIVAYHPPIFQPLTHLVGGRPAGWKQDLLLSLIRHGIAVYSPHTALDAVRGGPNDWLCEGLAHPQEVVRTVPLRPCSTQSVGTSKVVVFVPDDAVDRVREAMSEAGAGQIGLYRECFFESVGRGGFRPLPGAQPTIGKVGRREEVTEVRLEMLVSSPLIGVVDRVLRAVHPYEEPAIDWFAQQAVPTDPCLAPGAGRLLELEKPLSPVQLAERVRKRLALSRVKLATPAQDRTCLRHIAVCVGAGGSLFEEAGAADAFVTGEMQHHQTLDLLEQGRTVILTGHTPSERPFLPAYRTLLEKAGAEAVIWQVSEQDQAPFTWA